MFKWPLLVIVVYAAVVTGVAVLLAASVEAFESVDTWWLIGVYVAVMVLCQAGLLVVPVRVHSRRPVTTRHLMWPVLVSIFSCLALAGAMYMAAVETVSNSGLKSQEVSDWIFWFAMIIGGFWLIWTFLFAFYTGGREPRTFMQRIVKFLIAGSILELLVAVPTHVLARCRHYCCAGFLTVWGLAMGIAIMLLAFGPGVVALFIRRYQAISPPKAE